MKSQASQTVCIVGAGPAGVVLAYLLARKGVPVTLIEAQKDFEREFRGDTLHPSVMENLEELGLAEEILALPHSKARKAEGMIQGNRFTLVDFACLKNKTKYPYITIMAQSKFLTFMVEKCKEFPNFTIHMETKVTGLLKQGEQVTGVITDTKGKLSADLTVGCDGRFSTVRKQAGMEILKTAAPMDVLWFKLPKEKADGEFNIGGHISPGNILAQIDRGDYWQLGGIIPKGAYQEMHKKGLQSFRDRVSKLAPEFAERMKTITDWKQLGYFMIECGRIKQWYKPGLLLIGDAAHIMSPVGGVGINYAIQDAIVAANILTKPLLESKMSIKDLAQVQKKRIWPTRVIQWFQSLAHNLMIKQALRPDKPLKAPWFMKFMWVRKLLARFVAFGLWRVKVDQ